MIIKHVQAKSLVTKSNLPSVDFVINPYIGCQHACIYCYADFMKRFTKHDNEQWGSFVDIKDSDINQIRPELYNNSSILLSSVTDPYQPIEAQQGLTRKILERLQTTKGEVSILTKSVLVLRDIDLFKKFHDMSVGISLACLNPILSKKLEPLASPPQARINALKRLRENGVRTYLFMSPIFPFITDFKKIIELTKDYVDEYWFENINIRPNNVTRITAFLKENKPELLDFYEDLRTNPHAWDNIGKEIVDYCKSNTIKYKMIFHHDKR